MKYLLLGSVTLLMSVNDFGQQVIAQVVSDNTVGTTINLNGTAFEINNGMRSGNNLFHSFSQFSVPTNGSAIFNNATDVQNIFSRITGSQVSNIDGILKTQGGANLFLMNPNGIILGPNAQLQLGGSFLGTTANSIKFEDQIEFNTMNSTPALLSVKVPIGLQMGTNPGAIKVKGTGHSLLLPSAFAPIVKTGNPKAGLQVNPRQSLALIGGDISLDGGVLVAPQGRIDLISGSNGRVNLTPLAQGWQLSADPSTTNRNIELTNRSAIEASGSGGTAIQLLGNTIQLRKGSILWNNTQGFQPAGTIGIKATAALELTELDRSGTFGSFIFSDVVAGTGANITIETPNLSLSRSASISARSFGGSQSGNVTIKADTIQVDGADDRAATFRTGISLPAYDKSNAGKLTIDTDRLAILNGGIVTNSNFGEGRGNDVAVTANTIAIDGVNSWTKQVSLLSSATLNSGNAGNLDINTAALNVTNGGSISTSTLAGGNAGKLTIQASQSIRVSGQVLQSGFLTRSSISSGASIIPADLQKALRLPAIPSGASGDLVITTPVLSMSNGGTIRVNNDGSGNAGVLEITANSIDLKGTASITAATATGKGGDLQIQTQTLLLRDRSSITGTAGGSGKGGNITIISPTIVGIENSDIVANAFRGQGGKIQITTQGLFGLKFRPRLTLESDITASSEFGINGSVNVNTIGINPANALNALPIDVVDSSTQISDRCGDAQTSSFIATGRGGMPQSPMKARRTDRTWKDLRSDSRQTALIKPIANPIEPLTEASAFHIDASGAITLVSPQSPTLTSPPTTCTAGHTGS